MEFTKKQIQYMNQRSKTLVEIINSKPSKGIYSYHSELQTLQVLTKLHNMEFS